MTASSSAIDQSAARVLACGVFDLFHVGHLRYLSYARGRGAHLTALVSPDALVFAFKKKRPWIAQEQRMEILGALACVDRVLAQPGSWDDVAAVARWLPALAIDRVVVGAEWTGSTRWQRLAPLLASLDIALEFCPHTEHISTTEISAAIRARDAGLDRS